MVAGSRVKSCGFGVERSDFPGNPNPQFPYRNSVTWPEVEAANLPRPNLRA